MTKRELHMDAEGRITPEATYVGAPERGRPMIILVHGFNNDAVEASESYFVMRSNLDVLLKKCAIDENRRQEFQGRIWELFWPGYQAFTDLGPRGLRRSDWESLPSALAYSLQVWKARDWVPRRLAEYLRVVRPSEIFCIGHSLGCRVIFETLDQLRGSAIKISGFLLMAGAVPIDALMEGGRLRAAAASATRGYTLHSWRDIVLSIAFPPGQILAGEQPIYDLPVATGLGGWPANLFRGRSNTRLQHGDYWKEGLFKDRSTCRDLLAVMFNVATRQGLVAAELPSLPTFNRLSILSERHLSLWRLPDEDWLRQTYGPDAR